MAIAGLELFEEMIFSGEFVAGDKITEAKLIDLSEKSGCSLSRNSVRELFQLLATFYVVKQQQGSGTIIPKLSGEDISYWTKMRFDMEKNGIVSLIRRFNTDEGDELRKNFSKDMNKILLSMVKHGKEGDYKIFSSDSMFHNTISKYGSRQQSQEILRVLYLRTFLSSKYVVFMKQNRYWREDVRKIIASGNKQFVAMHEELYKYIYNYNEYEKLSLDADLDVRRKAETDITNKLKELSDTSVDCWAEAAQKSKIDYQVDSEIQKLVSSAF